MRGSEWSQLAEPRDKELDVLSRAMTWLQACKPARQDQARQARQGQGKTRHSKSHATSHLISSHTRAVRLGAFRERPEKLERSLFVAVPEGGRHRRIPGLRHSLENLLPSSGLQLNCDDPGRVRVPAVSPVGQSRRSVSPSSSYFIHFSPCLLFLPTLPHTF
jgi:hypothetical protein